MSKAPSWYADWRREAFDQLMSKQDHLKQARLLGSWDRFDYDLDTCSMTFSDQAGPKVRGAIQVVGSISDKNWLWAWANAAWPDESFEDLLKVRAFGVEHGIDELTSDYVEADDLHLLGWELAAVAARIAQAPGVYRGGTETPPTLFFLFRSVDFVI